MKTLKDIRYSKIYKAKNGTPGSSRKKTGKNGEDVIIRIPIGTLIKNISSGEIVADIIENNQKYIVCNGGKDLAEND